MKTVIIGLGWQGKRHYQALKELGVELTCVVDIAPKKVKERFPEYPSERISDNAKKLLKKYEPDIAIISTNAAARLQNIRFCCDAGIKKIFCEKPLATTLADALEIKKIAEDAGCLVAVNHLRRWNPNYHKLKEVLDNDVIGEIHHFYAQVGSVGLGNEGTHIIDKMRFCAESDVEWVIGFIDRTGTPNVRGPQYKDPGGWGMLKFKNGIRAFIDTSEDTGVPPVFEIVGNSGRIIIEELHNNWQILARSKENRDIPLTKLMTPLERVPLFDTLPWDVKEFTKYGLKELIFDNKTNCTVDDGCKALEAIFAFHISDSQNGKKISLPLDKTHHSLEVEWA